MRWRICLKQNHCYSGRHDQRKSQHKGEMDWTPWMDKDRQIEGQALIKVARSRPVVAIEDAWLIWVCPVPTTSLFLERRYVQENYNSVGIDGISGII